MVAIIESFKMNRVMKIVMLSNFFNHHQSPVSDELFATEGIEYWFIETRDMPETQKKLGYPDLTGRPYVVQSYKSEEMYNYSRKLIHDADVVIVGSAPENMFIDRIRDNKVTFRYSERWFKEIDWHLLDPRLWKLLYEHHLKYKNKQMYLLAASAYLPNDTCFIHAYPDKIYKWGYFPKVEEFDLEASLDVSRRGRATILWCARFLSWKHPELPVLLAKKLKDDGYEFHLDMIGSGEKFDETVTLAKSLGVDDVVSFLGNMPNDEVLQQMRKHSIFLFTSDKNEGWGAVLNESMSNGCAVVASNKIGAAPFLIEDGQNGLLFKSKKLDSLYSKVKTFLDDDGYRLTVARNAAMTMREVWSPQNAARRFVQLAERIMKGQDTEYTDGPCSKAYPYKG